MNDDRPSLSSSLPGQPLGILALQGGVAEHEAHLERLGVPSRLVRTPADLDGLGGIILPGGESTCLSRLLVLFGLDRALRQAHAQGLPMWGTCAGAILLARENIREMPHLGLMDIAVQRNAFGAQLDSFQTTILAPLLAPEPLPVTFIRAPQIVRVGPSVRVLSQQEGYITAAEDAQCLATVFHPELTPTLAFHRHFAQRCGWVFPESVPFLDPTWTPQRWMHVHTSSD